MASITIDMPAQRIIDLLTTKKLRLATAESCTSGLLAAALTDVPGASAVFYGGFVTYSNDAKAKMIGVPMRLIKDFGAVSAQVARAMAEGTRATTRSDFAIGITGIAGPSGGTDKKPVGLVYFAFASGEETVVLEKRFGPLSREDIRARSVETALDFIQARITAVPTGVNALRLV